MTILNLQFRIVSFGEAETEDFQIVNLKILASHVRQSRRHFCGREPATRAKMASFQICRPEIRRISGKSAKGWQGDKPVGFVGLPFGQTAAADSANLARHRGAGEAGPPPKVTAQPQAEL